MLWNHRHPVFQSDLRKPLKQVKFHCNYVTSWPHLAFHAIKFVRLIFLQRVCFIPLCVIKVVADNKHALASWNQLPCWRTLLLCQKKKKPSCLLTKASYSCCWNISHMLSVETQGMTVGASKDIQKKKKGKEKADYWCCQYRQSGFSLKERKFCWVLESPYSNED